MNGGKLSFTIYGKETRPANRTIKYVSETLGVTDPGEPIVKVDASLAPGARVTEQSSHRGLRSRLWKYVYVDGVATEKEILHTDSYSASVSYTPLDVYKSQNFNWTGLDLPSYLLSFIVAIIMFLVFKSVGEMCIRDRNRAGGFQRISGESGIAFWARVLQLDGDLCAVPVTGIGDPAETGNGLV